MGSERTRIYRRKAGQRAAPEVGALVERGLSGGGGPLEGRTQQELESRFGDDFSQVRIQTDAPAADAAEG